MISKGWQIGTALSYEAPHKNKTAFVPPAVRTPVFPHASPVTEGLKSAIRFSQAPLSRPARICNAFCPDLNFDLSQRCRRFVKTYRIDLGDGCPSFSHESCAETEDLSSRERSRRSPRKFSATSTVSGRNST